ncbi:MAG: sialidase family protein [Bellilinea sp.]
MTRKIVVLTLLVLIGLSSVYQNTIAQNDELWSEGVNISRSGSSSSPSFVINSQGLIHIFWLDEFDDLMYSRRNGPDWNAPQSVSAPSDVYVPRLYPGLNNQVHAFWIDEESKLYYNRAIGDNLSSPTAWSGSTILGESVVSFDVAVGLDGSVYLVYVQTADINNRPAGVYFRKSSSSGSSWQPPVLVYGSRYFRALGRDSANIQIAAGKDPGSEEIFIAWDNRPLKTVFFARSLNGGTEWNTPIEIASPQNRPSATTPYNIRIAILQNQIMLVYQDGQPGFSCSQIFQYSEDKGTTWSEPNRMMEDIPGCAVSSQLIEYANQYLILMTVNRDQVLLTAWNSNRWSKSKQQVEMMQVIDPLTRTTLTLTNQQILIDPEGRLNLIGADIEQGDIWLKQRDLSDIQSWFQRDTLWLPIETISLGNNSFSSVAITADSQGQPHAFWGVGDDNNLGAAPNTIFYSRREDQGRWIKPVLIYLSGNDYVDHISANFDTLKNNLLLVWRDGLKGEIYFSFAPSNQAFVSTAWSAPALVSNPNHIADSPKILIDPTGKLVVVYSIPINEERGIYLTTSEDGGLTWTKPAKILNALTYEFEAINNPEMIVVDETSYHLLWANYQFTANRLYPIGLHYSRSLDGGQNWTEPLNLTNAPVIWGQIFAGPNGVIHRIWQENVGSQSQIRHEYSSNQGESWVRVTIPSLLGEKIGTPAITIDPSGRIHLLQLLMASDNSISLQHLVWGNTWNSNQAKEIELNLNSNSSSLSAIISPNGILEVAISGEILNAMDNPSEYSLLYTGQTIENLPLLETPPAEVGIENNPEAPPIMTTQPEPTSQQTDIPRVINTVPPSIINPTIGILIGVLFSFLVIAAIVIYHIWQKNSG